MVRTLLRVVTMVLLVGALVVVPWLVVTLIGWPAPSWSQLHDAWVTHRLDADVVIRFGAALFVLLWAWFAFTAVAEGFSVFVHRSRGLPLPPVSRTPTGMLRRVVRFAVVSSAASASLFGVGGVHASAVPAVAAPSTITVGYGSPSPHQPDAPLTVDHPTGSTSVASSAPSAAREVSPLVAYVSGLGTALLLSAGVLGAIDARRRQHWRAAMSGTIAAAAPPELSHAESVMRSAVAGDLLGRLDLVVRAVTAELVPAGATLTAVLLDGAGSAQVWIDRPTEPPTAVWSADPSRRRWRLVGDAPAGRPGDIERPFPCPALVHLGTTVDGGQMFVDLEAVGVLAVDSPYSDDILRSVAATLAFSPHMAGARLTLVCVDADALLEVGVPAAVVDAAATTDAALAAARRAVGSTSAAAAAASTQALRAEAAAGERWEPAVVVAHESRQAVARFVAASVGLALVTDGVAGVDGWTLRFEGSCHVLEPLGVEVQPVGIGHLDLGDVVALAVAPVVFPPPSGLPAPTGSPVTPRAPVVAATYEDMPWELLVTVLGAVGVRDRDGNDVQFERSKALELVVWMSQHRGRSTRTAARTALWDLEVRSATFANVVSDARRSLAKCVMPPEGQEWIGRTLTEDLPLHPAVVTDAELLERRVVAARGLPARAAIEVLRPGVELLIGLPFAGTGFAWSDSGGHTSSLVLLATGAAIDLANHYLALDDVDGVFWATGQGLRVLNGHEELIALRMRAHGRRGDLSGVRSEWESYERALAADPWDAPEPAPKLVALRRELLA